MSKTPQRRRLADAYAFPGFRAGAGMRGRFGDPQTRIVTLARRAKKRAVGPAGRCIAASTTARAGRYGDLSSGPFRVYLDLEVRRVRCGRCAAVKRERLEFLADNPFYTQRFAHYVGRPCRSATIKDIAEELRLDWDEVKKLDKQYMRAQLKRAGTPGPKGIGIDEISIRKGHTYRIVVSDLIRHRPIWFGGQDRTETSMDEFYRFIGEKKAKKIRLAVMDMWKPFYNSTRHHAPQAAVLVHLGISALRRLPGEKKPQKPRNRNALFQAVSCR